MNNAIDRITLDVRSPMSQAYLRWKRGDTARTIEATLTQNGNPYLLDGCTVSFTSGIDEGKLYSCEIRDNRVIFDAVPALTEDVAVVPCEFRVIGGGKVLTTARFTITVDNTVIDPDKVEEDEKGEISTLDKLISDASELVEDIATKLENGEFDGEDGAKWLYGTVSLEGASPIDKVPGAKTGDWYLNQNTYAMFVADEGYWLYVGNVKGADGKSAYQYAKDAGFPGTEAEFAELLASIGSGGGGTVNLSDYYKKAETYNRSEIDNKVGAVAANAQPKGDYALRSEIPTNPDDIGAQAKGDYALKSDIPDIPVKSVNDKTGAVQLTAADVGARESTWTPTYSDVGADKNGTAASAVSAHNVSADSHNDIRLLIGELTTRLNALADSDDATLDQMSEVVAYIKANKSLIDSITTSKVNVTDIVNNLTTNVVNKPLSAAQGVALKALIDAITVPTKLSELLEDSTHRVVTDAEKAAWDAKSDFSGAYSDLTGKPTKVSAFENDKGYVTNDKTITITGVDENGVTHTWTVYGV